MTGFFRQSEFTSKRPLTMVAKCGECGMYQQCESPKMQPSGKGKRRVLIVGEAPGAKEDELGRQFVGKTGQRLRNTLRKFAVEPDRDCIFTNALICRPPNNEIPEGRQTKLVDCCRPNLIKTINQYNPDVIIPLGKTAIKSLIGWIWKEDVGSVERWAGFQIPSQKPNVWICPNWHPSFVERADDRVLDRIWEENLRKAFEIEGKPWDEIPDYRKEIHCIIDPEEAADVLTKYHKTTNRVSFDYETNMLKPDSTKARIVCCSVCFDGKYTIAFPWHGKAIREMLAILWDDRIKKIGFNLKFEDRYTRAKYGKGVKNWKWCGMTAAHVLDNRPDITSLKFQAFVLFGVDAYDAAIKPYLRTRGGGGNEENRIREVSLRQLLDYCGMDSFLEYKVWQRQYKELYHE